MGNARRTGTPTGVPARRSRFGAVRIGGLRPTSLAANDNAAPLPRRLHRLLPFAVIAVLVAALLWALLT